MKKILLIFTFSVVLLFCKTEKKTENKEQMAAETSTSQKADDWTYLFDGTTTEGWRAYNGEDLPPQWEEINNAKLEDWQKTGVDYAMYIPDKSQKIAKPAGEWNTSRVIFTPEKVEHWLNGKKILSFVLWSEDWEKRKSGGKWKESPKYGTFESGYIGFQDHDSPLWLKNIKIKKL